MEFYKLLEAKPTVTAAMLAGLTPKFINRARVGINGGHTADVVAWMEKHGLTNLETADRDFMLQYVREQSSDVLPKTYSIESWVDNHKGSLTVTENKVTVQTPTTDPIELVPEVYLTEPEVKCGQTMTTYIVATFFSLDQRRIRSVMSEELWGTRLNHSKSVSKASTLLTLCEALEGFFPPPENVVSMSGPAWHNHVWLTIKNMDYTNYLYLTMSLAYKFFNVIEFKDGQPGIRTYMEGKVKKMVCPVGTVIRWNESMMPKEERPKLKKWKKKHGFFPLIVVKGMETSIRLPEQKIVPQYVYAFVSSAEKMIGGQSGSYGWFLNTRHMITMPEPAEIVNKVTLSVAITAAKTYPYLKFQVDMPMSGLYKAVQAIYNHKIDNLRPKVTKKEYSSLSWPPLEKGYLDMVEDADAYLITNISNTTPTPSGKLKLTDVLAQDSAKKIDVYGPRAILIGSICGPAFFEDRYVSTWWGLGYSGVSSPFPLGVKGWFPGSDAPVQVDPPGQEGYVADYYEELAFLEWVDTRMRLCLKAWANPILLSYNPTFHLEGPPIEGRSFLHSQDGTMSVYAASKVSFKKEEKTDPVPIDDAEMSEREDDGDQDEDFEALPDLDDIEGGRDDYEDEEELIPPERPEEVEEKPLEKKKKAAKPMEKKKSQQVREDSESDVEEEPEKKKNKKGAGKKKAPKKVKQESESESEEEGESDVDMFAVPGGLNIPVFKKN